MNYIEEFNRIYLELAVSQKRLTDFYTSKGLINPFTKENYETYKKIIENCETDEMYIYNIKKLISKIHNKTVKLMHQANEEYYPIMIRYFDGDYYIVSSEINPLINKQIIEINHKKIDEYLQNENNINYNLSYDIKRGKPYTLEFIVPKTENFLQIKIQKDNKKLNLFLAKSYEKNILSQKLKIEKESNIKLAILSESIYVRINSFDEKDIIKIEDTINQNNKLFKEKDVILDLRTTSGEDENYINLLNKIPNVKYILIDGNTENKPNDYILNKEDSILIGMPTGGSSENLEELQTPILNINGYKLLINKDFHDKRVNPDIPFEESTLLSSNDYGTENDSFLNKLIPIINSEKVKKSKNKVLEIQKSLYK